MENIIIIAAVAIIVAFGVAYILKQKKKGNRCIGCSACNCKTCPSKQENKENI